LYQEYIRIPFLIYDDSDTHYPNLEYANQIDVAPTIVDRLGLLVPSSWQGRSLLKPDIKPFHFHQTFIREPTCYAVVYRIEGKIYKYIRCTRGKTEELYRVGERPWREA
jgi:arylsulfatase A-like enzyme